MFRLPNTLGFRLTLWYASAFLTCLGVAFLGLYISLNSILNSHMDADLLEDIEEFQELFREHGVEKVLAEIEREMNSTDTGEVFFRLYDAKKNLLYSSDVTEWHGLDSATTLSLQKSLSSSESQLQTIRLPEQDYPARVVSGLISSSMTLQIGETLEKNEEIMELLRTVFGAMLLFGIPVASGVGWMIARKAVSGIQEVSRGAKAIEQGNLDHRVSVGAQGDEIQTLADTFNAMATQIKHVIQEMREMTDNIAHDLRSPLARIRAMSETVITERNFEADCTKMATETLKECDRLMHLINTTLDMAEFDAGVAKVDKTPIHLDQLLTDLVELFEPLAEAKPVSLKISLARNCQMVGDKHSLQRMIANLLDNAIKYTPGGGQVSIALEQIAHEFRLTVADTGLGIPLSDQPRVFDRFFRCDHSRSQEGCGLGLSFARSVARAHGGDITLRSETTKGSIFTSILPATPST